MVGKRVKVFYWSDPDKKQGHWCSGTIASVQVQFTPDSAEDDGLYDCDSEDDIVLLD